MTKQEQNQIISVIEKIYDEKINNINAEKESLSNANKELKEQIKQLKEEMKEIRVKSKETEKQLITQTKLVVKYEKALNSIKLK